MMRNKKICIICIWLLKIPSSSLCFQPGVCDSSVLRPLPTEKVTAATSRHSPLKLVNAEFSDRVLIVFNHLSAALWVWPGWKQICKRGYERAAPKPPPSTSTRACRTNQGTHTLTHTFIHVSCPVGTRGRAKQNVFMLFFCRVFCCICFLNLPARSCSTWIREGSGCR